MQIRAYLIASTYRQNRSKSEKNLYDKKVELIDDILHFGITSLVLRFFFQVTKSKSALSEFDDLVKDYWDWRLEDNPNFAYEIGVHEYDDRVEQFTLDVLDKRNVSKFFFKSKDLAIYVHLF